MNPIHGIVRGEAVIDGDASGGIDITLYAVTPGWAAITADSGMLATGGPNGLITVTGGEPFISSMVGKTITFIKAGSKEILRVISSTEIQVFGDLSEMKDEVFAMAAQEGLRIVELDMNDELHITDIFLSQEKDSEYIVGEDVPGKRIIKGRLLEMGSVNLRFVTPFVCSPNGVLKYFGHDNGLNVCIIHGYIT